MTVDAMIGEESQFHQTFAYYGQGVSLGTAVLGPGWQGGLVRFDVSASVPAEARCLDPHDLVLAKLAAHREKDLDDDALIARFGGDEVPSTHL